MREWSGFDEPGQRGEACEGSDVEEDPVAAQRACSSTVERDLDGPFGNKAAPSHHEFAAAGGEFIQMRLDQAFHHGPLAGLNFPHRHTPGDTRSERLACGYSMSDACAVDEVLARQAGNIGAGTAHIALLDDHDAFAGTAEMPRDRFSRLAAAEHHGIIGINCGQRDHDISFSWRDATRRDGYSENLTTKTFPRPGYASISETRMPVTFVALLFAFRASDVINRPQFNLGEAANIGLDRRLGGTLQCSYAATGEFSSRLGLPPRVRRH